MGTRMVVTVEMCHLTMGVVVDGRFGSYSCSTDLFGESRVMGS